jgi:hypothetical protein
MEAGMNDERRPVAPDGARDGDVLILQGGVLYVVDHLVPESFTIDLVAMQADESSSARPATTRAHEDGTEGRHT